MSLHSTRRSPYSILALTISALIWMPCLHAQTSQDDTKAPAPGGQILTLDEVVVSAQKRTERLQDTPVAAAVLSEKALERANITDIADLTMLVPAIQIKGSFNDQVLMAMRGISTNANSATIGLTSGVLVMVDGIPVSSNAQGVHELQDLMRVEVLKGPQATLGGRAASAGVIHLVTRMPSFDWSGQVSTLVTHDGEYKFSGFLSGPLSTHTAFSLSVHNAPAGLWSIARGDCSEISAFAAEVDALEHGVMEACGLLDEGANAVLLVVAEESPAPLYRAQIDDVPFSYALALKLTAGTHWRLQLSAGSGPRSRWPHALELIRALCLGHDHLRQYWKYRQWDWSCQPG